MNEVQEKAMEVAMKYERGKGNNPQDVSKDKNHKGYDILSNGIKIEVKGRGKDKRPHVLLNDFNIKGIEETENNNYKLYVVMNPINNPKLIIFSKEEILNESIKQRSWTIPLRKRHYERGIALK